MVKNGEEGGILPVSRRAKNRTPPKLLRAQNLPDPRNVENFVEGKQNSQVPFVASPQKLVGKPLDMQICATPQHSTSKNERYLSDTTHNTSKPRLDRRADESRPAHNSALKRGQTQGKVPLTAGKFAKIRKIFVGHVAMC